MYVFTLSLFVILVIQQTSGFKEPECSRYHYEEQILERVVRMGMEFEYQKKDVTNILETVAAKLDAFSKELQVLKRENEELKSSLRDEVQISISDLEKVKEKSFLPFIFFNSKNVADTTIKAGHTIVFTETLVNDGNAYDNTTGIFTAPEDGIYLVSLHMCVKNKQNLYYGLVIDGKESLRGEMYEYRAVTCNSVQQLLTIKAGNRVWIQVYVKDVVLLQSANHWNMFSAFLLNKG
ncbi:heavy metal-binding protein HIP-like [Mya arenaria]|uniref:heavy metal-binding protein HIP-like n=1 Tax=Mya arenaria TaxID=6604 RepID=UPI0022DFEE33|nr:heavy metal-binding protein HIP-like [Mya arenaria]